MDIQGKLDGPARICKPRDKQTLQLADGETKYEKLFINPVGMRKRTLANTKPIMKRQMQDQFESSKPYKHGIDVNSFGTDRKMILDELKRKTHLIKDNEQIIDQICKVKNSNEFIKEYPVCIQHMSPIVKYYKNDVHSKLTAAGYSRNDYGRAYFS